MTLPSLRSLLEPWLPWLPPGSLLGASSEPPGSLLGASGGLLGASGEPLPMIPLPWFLSHDSSSHDPSPMTPPMIPLSMIPLPWFLSHDVSSHDSSAMIPFPWCLFHDALLWFPSHDSCSMIPSQWFQSPSNLNNHLFGVSCWGNIYCTVYADYFQVKLAYI